MSWVDFITCFLITISSLSSSMFPLSRFCSTVYFCFLFLRIDDVECGCVPMVKMSCHQLTLSYLPMPVVQPLRSLE